MAALILAFPVASAELQVGLRLAPSIEVVLSGEPGFYGIQWATNVSSPIRWRTLSNVTVRTQLESCADPVLPVGARYYRAVSLTIASGNGAVNSNWWTWVQPGTFVMGSPTNEPGRDDDEVQHEVTLTHGFFIAKYETTQREYMALMTNNPSWFSTNHGFAENLDRPVDWVTWQDATNFCARLNTREHRAGLPANWSYRLPTEAEWEYACRAGTITSSYTGGGLTTNLANFNSVYGATTTTGTFPPNPWDLSDAAGNVWEWCRDRYDAYPSGSATDPQGPSTGVFRVLRGGAWNSGAPSCRSAYRHIDYPDTHSKAYGFRCVLAPTET